MKKILVMNTLISVCFLSACSSSPPEPPQIDEDAPTIYLNNQVYRQTPTATVAKNAGDHNGQPWVYQYVNLDRNDYVNETEKVRFFYFAHHADSIEIYGQPARTEAYKYWLQANGVSANISTHPKDLLKNNVNITFRKGVKNEKAL
ncbi:cag pathogenicity island Cag12 family protein [Aggregatibacter actinomycetemcomitans]|uniref:cag pathogenicity island Cag12 family protein n=1 Tax=Aggregatibacter actinomycetemcomitans TaxID=714 RepID=UPI0011DAACB4|nr:cag pathogenicity island Cag12 family protein [Aggregatibacter actinomycetemcomitans]TYA97891.1 hypothetical protein FXE11_10360 [Aggregatibacter actinomycetemcomitans]TYB11480.1 hypothetical protein FXB82_10325 [Aggregatibacter actinomycetemcomitans]TYB19009.1 hypothetical protein FXB71_10580 [Aggregatibacter actinomycetemcomitans]